MATEKRFRLLDSMAQDGVEEYRGPLAHTTVLQSDLNENSTRYDQLGSAASYEEQEIMWLVWMLITGICSAIILIVFLGLLSSTARKKTFNIYLLCLMPPDLLFSSLCFVTCLQNYLLGYYSSMPMCRFQAFYSIFAIASNAWLNAVICKQVHNMLICAKTKNVYQPPSTMQVLTHASAVYLWSLFVASWTLVDLPLDKARLFDLWPHQQVLISGVACLPMDFNTSSTIFFYCVFFPALIGVPLVYTFYLMYDIRRKDLLPPKGKRRQMTIFFLRLIMVFLVMWTPAIILIYILGQWMGPWIAWIGGSWCHFQGAVSALVSLLKPDVYQAVKNFVTCQWNAANEEAKQKRIAQQNAKKLEGYTKELQTIQKELHSLNNNTASLNQYTKELADLARELQTTKETVEKETAPMEMGLLEEIGDGKAHNRCRTPPLLDIIPFVEVAKGVPSMIMEEHPHAFGVDQETPRESTQDTDHSEEETESDEALETFAASQLSPEQPENDSSLPALTNSDSNLMSALGLDHSESNISDEESQIIDFAVDAEETVDNEESLVIDFTTDGNEGIFEQAWKFVKPATSTVQLELSVVVPIEDYDT